jgi:DNA-binding transcriptional LysR family regulator
MRQRFMPSMMALQCFDAVARHMSVTRAAEELHMTQSAVSKQISQLEVLLRNPLFTRVRRRLQLTPAGSIYQAEVRDILNQVDMASRYVLAYGGET